MASNDGPSVGIDLGTTFSALSYINQHGRPEILPNREGGRITPSVVFFENEAPIVGDLARRAALARPLDICQFVKRRMGEAGWRFTTGEGAEYTAEEVSALILRRLIEDAQLVLNREITEAVITVPAYFNDAQRKATMDASTIAGLGTVHLINEPTAAALAYGVSQSDEQTVMVYDLGGGTFDVTVMHLREQKMKVIATDGNKNLGGFDWDKELMTLLNDRFQEAGGVDLTADPGHEQDLREKSELAKRTLSSVERTTVFLSAEGTTVSVELSRSEFEEATAGLVKQTEQRMVAVLEQARLDWGRIDKVLLVGGSTRMAAVAALVERVSGRKPALDLHPDEVVACGAATFAENRRETSEATGRSVKVEVVDVNSHSLGTDAYVDGKVVNSIILPKGTALGERMSNVYVTRRDNQKAISIWVTEGEGENIDDVHVIDDDCSIEIPSYRKGAPFEVSFQSDQDGIIHVGVRDVTTGQHLGEFDIHRKANRSAEEIKEATRKLAALEVK